MRPRGWGGPGQGQGRGSLPAVPAPACVELRWPPGLPSASHAADLLWTGASCHRWLPPRPPRRREPPQPDAQRQTQPQGRGQERRSPQPGSTRKSTRPLRPCPSGGNGLTPVQHCQGGPQPPCSFHQCGGFHHTFFSSLPKFLARPGAAQSFGGGGAKKNPRAEW